jgi:hypothetical protein
MAETLRHRQTKEAATDMFSLQPPRHIPTLPTAGRVSWPAATGAPLKPAAVAGSHCFGREAPNM